MATLTMALDPLQAFHAVFLFELLFVFLILFFFWGGVHSASQNSAQFCKINM